MGKVRVLCFIDSLGSGGAQRQLVGLAVLLQEAGYDVEVCSYHNLDFYKHFLDEYNVKNTIIEGANDKFMRILKVCLFFKKRVPDWVIAYQETPSLIACLAKFLGCINNLIVSERNTTQFVRWSDNIRFQLYRVATAIVPNSYTQTLFLKRNYPWMDNKIYTISNFVDLEKFSPQQHKRATVVEVVVAASLWESKNARGLLDACKILKEKKVKVHFSWYGINEDVTDYQKRTIAMVQELNISDMISFLPKIKKIEHIYKTADFFCLPSFYEGTPNVICEAISSGLPIICSDVCDNGLYVLNGENGFLFDPHSPIDIADKIINAIQLSEQDYQSFREKSREIAMLKLSKDSFLMKYESILKGKQTAC